jgi:hypothetical protein
MTGDSAYPRLRTCVRPEGRFVVGRHDPVYTAANLRVRNAVGELGRTAQGDPWLNSANFPAGDVAEQTADKVFEIPNPLPFRGVTYICKGWADRAASDPAAIRIETHEPVSLHGSFEQALGPGQDRAERVQKLLAGLPAPVKLAVAATSCDPRDLQWLAAESCRLMTDPASGRPVGLACHSGPNGLPEPLIRDRELFETVANNPCLPDDYKRAMVLRPGVQGASEIVGEWQAGGSHIYEYLRRNSYIPWGHYAANMAEDAVRYAAADLGPEDIRGLRHLYYQRTYVRLARDLGHDRLPARRVLPEDELEDLRHWVVAAMGRRNPSAPMTFTATLWGWNYGFDYAPSGYRLHASHQQVHQQFALVPDRIPTTEAPDGAALLASYACGDRVHDFVKGYRRLTGKDFFECYLRAIRANTRLDGETTRPASLVVYEDKQVLLFVPKAQTSQWELQLMPLSQAGNILETDRATRRSLDRAMLTAMHVLTGMGARMITVFEYSKRFTHPDTDQRLLYVFLPRLPQSPGAFSEAQLRWINGHYPEDFAAACRMRLDEDQCL